jgi:hypothetical protein
VREFRSLGSERGAARKGGPYRDFVLYHLTRLLARIYGQARWPHDHYLTY